MSLSAERCITCVARGEKYDSSRPVCRHCTRDWVKCGGYFYIENPTRGVSDSRKSHLGLPISTPDVNNFGLSEPVSNRNHSGRLPASSVLYSDVGITSGWLNPKNSIPSDPLHPTPIKDLRTDSAPARNDQNSAPSAPIPRQAPPAPNNPTDSGAFDELSRKRLFPENLAQPGNDCNFLGGSSCDQVQPGPRLSGASYTRDSMNRAAKNWNQNELEDSQNAQGIGAKLCSSLALDKKVKSNTLPFILQSYALWIKHFLFEPIRIIPLAKEYISEEYSGGSDARWRMLTISSAVRTITGSTGYTLEDVEVLQSHMHRGFAATTSKLGVDREADRFRALLAMSSTYEFISVSVKVLPLSPLLKTMQAVAPIFRLACSEPGDRLVNPLALLSNINVGLEYYATLDILLNTTINRPMNLRYDTTFPVEICETVFDLENGPGTRWVYGVPDRLLIIFARMNALLEEFGSSVDMELIEELSMSIDQVRNVVLASSDPSLEFGRLVVQECWRQAAYIYLYMGLCGANSHDARIIKAHSKFMQLFSKAKLGRIPDSFLVLPLPILGIAARHLDDQEYLKRRMLALPEVARKGTCGNQFIRMLECIWDLANESERPANWSDLRLASLLIAGV